MNVYDFDGTIYDGDSTIDFFVFSLKRNAKIRKCMPEILWTAIKYKVGKVGLNIFKEKFYSFVKYIDSLDEEVELFWETHHKKIKGWYLERKQETDVIISASPQWLLEPIAKQLEVELIASLVDPNTGKLLSKNCKGEEKVCRFTSKYEKGGIEKFYSDSKSDQPLAQMAQEAFLVKGDRIKPFKIE